MERFSKKCPLNSQRTSGTGSMERIEPNATECQAEYISDENNYTSIKLKFSRRTWCHLLLSVNDELFSVTDMFLRFWINNKFLRIYTIFIIVCRISSAKKMVGKVRQLDKKFIEMNTLAFVHMQKRYEWMSLQRRFFYYLFAYDVKTVHSSSQ